MFVLGITTLLVTSLACIPSLESAITLPENVTVLHLWKNIEFAYPSEADRNQTLEESSYVAENVMLNDVDVWEGQNSSGRRIFVTSPRFTPGVPFTLSIVTSAQNGESNLLAPFPNLQSQAVSAGCNSIISVDKIHIDKCGRLWVIDTGILHQFTNATRVCQPKVLIYDLEDNDKLIERYEFPSGVVKPESSLTTAVTDIRGDKCQETIAYICDLHGNALIVFDLANRTSWRIQHNFFYPWPNRGTLTISGITFDLMDPVFGLALGPVLKEDGDRLLYFHSLASLREGWVSTNALRNKDLIKDSDKFRSLFTLSEEFRSGQCSLEVMTDDGIMIYNDLPTNSLMCWNTKLSATGENTHRIYQDNEHLQFISGMKLKGDQLWLASNQAQNIISQTKTNDFRYRIILIESVRQLLQKNGGKCLNPQGVQEDKPTTSTEPLIRIDVAERQTPPSVIPKEKPMPSSGKPELKKNMTHGWRIDPPRVVEYKNALSTGANLKSKNVTHGWRIDPHIPRKDKRANQQTNHER